MKFYLDTSIFGGLFDEGFDQPTHELFKFIERKNITVIYSRILGDELGLAPEHVRVKARESLLRVEVEYIEDITKEVLDLANTYIEVGALKRRSINDAQHIAIATIAGANAIITWNFRHMANFIKIEQYNDINLQKGYRRINIYSPMEIIKN